MEMFYSVFGVIVLLIALHATSILGRMSRSRHARSRYYNKRYNNNLIVVLVCTVLCFLCVIQLFGLSATLIVIFVLSSVLAHGMLFAISDLFRKKKRLY